MTRPKLDLLSMKEAATELGMTRQGVFRLSKEGEIGQKVGDAWIYTREEIEAYKNRPRTAGRPAGSKTNGVVPTLVTVL
jgi:predicted DNA-binding transcriptional regulator AlpA